jgi:diguanylate cyclase (GGDEF)-like protein
MTGLLVGFWLATHLALPLVPLTIELILGLATGVVLWAIEFLPQSLFWRATAAVTALTAMIAVLVGSRLLLTTNIPFVFAIGVVLGPYLFFERQRSSRWEELKRQADTDHLTGAGTRYAFRRFLDQHALSQGVMIVADLDNFKTINDTWGHDVGDVVLQELAHRFRSTLRTTDGLVRWGGDEFVIVMPSISESQAHGVVQRLHTAVTATPVLYAGLSLPLEISIGWAWGRLGDATILTRADQRLLRAKRLGKNCVVGDDAVVEVARPRLATMSDVNFESLAQLLDVAYDVWAIVDPRGRVVAASGRFRAQYPSLNEGPWGATWDGWQPWKDVHGQWQFVRLLPLLGDWRDYKLVVIAQDVRPASPWHWPGRIDLAWQPIADPGTGMVFGHEVFARPRLGDESILPDLYFAWARWIGAEAAADALCLQQVAKAVEQMAVPPHAPYLFVNVHPASLTKPQGVAAFINRVRERDRRWRLVLEVTEAGTQALTAEQWISLDQQVPSVEWAQDDFGVGEQDLLRLLQWRPKWVKLDRALIAAASRRDNGNLGRWFIPWAHTLGLRVIAEGVETAAEAQWCRDAGFDGIQGWFVGKPEALRETVPASALR